MHRLDGLAPLKRESRPTFAVGRLPFCLLGGDTINDTDGHGLAQAREASNVEPYSNGRDAARALLSAGLAGQSRLSQRAGQFVGGIAFGDPDVLTERQADWMGKLLARADLPPLAEQVTQ